MVKHAGLDGMGDIIESLDPCQIATLCFMLRGHSCNKMPWQFLMRQRFQLSECTRCTEIEFEIDWSW